MSLWAKFAAVMRASRRCRRGAARPESAPGRAARRLEDEGERGGGEVDRNAVVLPRELANEDGLPPKSIQLLIEVYNVEDAIRLIDQGLIIEYMHHNCERFEGEARATQCFNCGKWGRKAKFCTVTNP
ncbi:hypothetical protein B0T26DRAFT_755135 [Lasiosphaeria miniovina]|uniref:CCHC-type domain-containing protein n=1 Tax=Lasiosphaeria miniovina TaxID=1954250 RepID=A0AA40DQR6_9PEZI|nr:uncharacterized protein B0T26DRAFT_755135 [Lasiosphaeria miniovina]KAK0710016.1 hypothetical protein B0T26DRAFT_755135 [Lasiosphaeria miniovina]